MNFLIAFWRRLIRTKMIQVTEHFKMNEFACKDGTPVPTEFWDNVIELCEQLEVLREELGSPIHVLSGYRTESHNKAVGGASHSQHLEAKAADIVSRNHKPSEVHATIENLIADGKMKQGGLGHYGSFTHYDIRGHRARWHG